MIDYDLHIHTEYCGHAPGMTVEAILRQAEALGLSTIAITDHIFEQADHANIQKIREDVATYNPDLKVFVGAEVDVNADHTDGRLVTQDLSNLDIVIAGFHYIPTLGTLPRSQRDNTLDRDEFMKHWSSSLLGIVSNFRINTLAHPGRLLAASVDLETHFGQALEVFENAAEISARTKVAWELNELTGHRLSPKWQDQWYRIYKIALDKGVKLVYGSDAHTPECVGLHTFVDRLLEKLPKGCISRPEEVV